MRQLLVSIVFCLGLTGGFVLPAPAAALQQAQAEAQATAAGDGGGTQLDTQTVTATASQLSSGFDSAEAAAESTTLGSLRSRSAVSGASGTNGPSDADARAAWFSDLVTAGSDPGAPVDLDLDLTVSGTLTYLNNNGGASADDIRSSVRLEITLVSGATVLNPFDGTAELTTVTNSSPPALNRTGSWSPPARDADFTVVSCSAFSCQVDVAATVSLPDAIDVDFGEPFSLEVQLHTDAFIWNGRESLATAEFFNTASVTISTDTPGVVIEAAPDSPAEVPALGPIAGGVLALLLSGGGLVALRRRE